ncbi:MAG: type II toxin-antitoxin system VapC family toxin [Terracidiphilus sp.]
MDSSFLVSSYVSDSHSSESDRRRMNSPALWLTPLNRAEFARAVYQYVFRSQMNLAHANQLWSVFQEDCERGVWIRTGFPESAWRLGVELARKHGPTLGVRTLDTLHVACALELKAERFWTFDERQGKLAEAVGLETSG